MTESPNDPANYPLDGCEPVQPSLSFLAEAQPRLKTGEDKEHFLQRCTLNFLSDRTNYKAKTLLEKLQISFVSTRTFFK
jgi:hypothetical protein